MNLVESLSRLILLFFAYSFAGWCMEVVLKWIQYHRFINRGFFTGPVCPIYGSGAMLITIVMEDLLPFESGYSTTFVISFVLCGLVEYLTSYFMEKKYHARWWDYSQKPMNLHGRIWIGNLILFGLGGVAIIHLINPYLYLVTGMFPVRTQEILAAGLMIIFGVDYAGTHFILKMVKAGVESSQADSTEEINREIRVLLSDKSVFARRFAEAYPEVIYRTERINARLERVRAETERLRGEAERVINDQAQQVRDRLEPAAMIKNSIISKQDQLINLLYDDQTAGEEMKSLKAEIDREKARISARPLAQVIARRENAD